MVQDEFIHLRVLSGRWRREDIGERRLRIDGRRGLFPYRVNCNLKVRMEPTMKDYRESSFTDISVIVSQVQVLGQWLR